MADEIYFALLPAKDNLLTDAVLSRVDQAINFARSARIYERYRVNYNLYYGIGPGALWSDNLRPGGEDGESVDLSINIARQLLQKQLAMILGVRPPIIPKAISTDADAARKVQVGRSLIEKAFRKLGGYAAVDGATEQAEAIGAGFVHGTWDHFAGGLHGVGDPDQVPEGVRARHEVVMGDDGQPQPKIGADGQPMMDEQGAPVPQIISKVFKGEAKFEKCTVKDIYFDPTSTDWSTDRDWTAIRAWRNRYDQVALYPECAQEILDANTRASVQFNEWDVALPTPNRGAFDLQFTDDKILVWYFYHRRTPAVPEGRMVLFLDDGTVLEDGTLPFKDIPLWRVCPSTVIDTAIPYGPMQSLGSIQEAFNNLWGSIITNVMAFGRQILWTYKGSGVEYSALGGGLKLLELDPPPNGGDPVKPLDLMLIKDELFKVSEALQSFGQADTGVNAIAQGDPRGVTAGISINLFESMAQQFASPLEAARTDAMEAMALWVLEAYRQHPDMERDLHVVGEDRETALAKFYGKDLDGLDDVDVEAGNPMDRTVPGRLQKLSALRETGAPITPEQAMQVLDTGNFDSATDGVADEMALIEAENESMAKGQPVAARMGDNHILHMQGHRKVGSNPEVRLQDAQMRMQYALKLQQSGLPPGHPNAPPLPSFPLGALSEHEMQHLQLWTQGDPVLNMVQGRVLPGPQMIPQLNTPMEQVQQQGKHPSQPGSGAPPPAGAKPPMPPGAPRPPPRTAPPAKPQNPADAFKPPPVAPLPPIGGAQQTPQVQ